VQESIITVSLLLWKAAKETKKLRIFPCDNLIIRTVNSGGDILGKVRKKVATIASTTTTGSFDTGYS
jgi:hypothetical protein